MDHIEKIFRLPPDSPVREEALTHKSYARNESGAVHNARLAALGKALMQAFLTEYLLERFPGGAATTIEQNRASLMERKLVVAYAKDVGVQGELWVEENRRGSPADSLKVIASAFHALVGASYQRKA